MHHFVCGSLYTRFGQLLNFPSGHLAHGFGNPLGFGAVVRRRRALLSGNQQSTAVLLYIGHWWPDVDLSHRRLHISREVWLVKGSCAMLSDMHTRITLTAIDDEGRSDSLG
jgi:hypothetical protein